MAAKKKLVREERRSTLPVFLTRGEKLSFHDDLYPFLLRLSWSQFFGLFAILFVVVNLLFAALYSLFPHCVLNAGGFLDNFFFSVETLATIGYGEMTPNGVIAHSIVTLEAFVGIGATAMMTGLIFARFARPTAKILFSDKMVIAKWNGIPHLMFRMANRRRNQLAEAVVSASILLTEKTLEGHIIRKPTEFPLARSKNSLFALSWMAMHPIIEGSPFYGAAAMAKLKEMKSEIFVTLTGFDETLMQTVTARWRYQLDDIVPDSHFADIILFNDDGTRVIDYDLFHEVVSEKTS